LDRAHQKVGDILKSHQPEVLYKDVEKVIDEQDRFAFKSS
jgi:hypothetical protein